MRKLNIIALLTLLATASMLTAQGTMLRGKVLDSAGLVMSGVDVKVYQADNVLKVGVSDEEGTFNIEVPPGEYRIEVSAPDFDTHTELVRVVPDMNPLSISMTLAILNTVVDVSEARTQLSVESDSSLTTTTLSGEALADLPDDEDELAAYLQQIAGSRGAAGEAGSFVIDGFSGGRLPPRDQIQEIRINNNPFSTEFSGQGFGRLEIITRAGTGNWRGGLNFNFEDEALNARNPFSPTKPPYQTRNFGTNVGGPVIPGRLTINFNAGNNQTENSGTIRAFTPAGSYNEAFVSPTLNRNFSTRAQLALTRNNTLNFNLSYRLNKRENQGLNEFTLPERASDSDSRNWQVQVRETAIITPTVIHELRFQYSLNTSETTPRTTGFAVNVPDAFNGGGGQNRSNGEDQNYEFGNMLMWSGSKWTIKSGIQGNHAESYNRSESNFIGTFTFASLAEYQAGRALTFRRNQGNPEFDLSQFELGAFIQTDWRIKPQFTVSMGARYESQTNLDDYNNFDPRIGFAYQLRPTTVIRGGSGIFHQRFAIGNVETLLRNNGTNQSELVIRNTFYPDPFQAGQFTVVLPSSIRVKAEDLAAPYNINSSLMLEQQLPGGMGMTASFDVIRGLHLLRSRNINAPLPGTTSRPDPLLGNVNMMESTGKSLSKNLSLGFSKRSPALWNLGFFGNYTLGWSDSDSDGATGNPMDNYNLALDWGRSNFDTRHRFSTRINFTAPSNIFINLSVNANSGRPYNITTGRDDNGDTVINDRPSGLSRNSGTAPGTYNVGMNFSKSINLRRETSQGAASAANPFLQHGGDGGGMGGGGGVQRGPGGGVPGGGMGRPGGGPGGFGNPGGPVLRLSLDFQNLLNNTQVQGVSGVLTSPLFGKATRAADGRSVSLRLNLNF